MASTNATSVPFTDARALTHHVYASPPFYYSPRPRLVSALSDEFLSLALPVAAYWLYSAVFELLDAFDPKALRKYRIHDSAEVRARNLVSRPRIFAAVLLQHLIQTIVGALWIGTGNDPGHKPQSVLTDIPKIRDALVALTRLVLGDGPAAAHLLRVYGPNAVWFMYWWAIPALQFLFSIFIVDTWQYFLHRAFHTNRFLYRHFHSWHHSLYVPYAFGALYNHPLEGLLLDTLGAVISQTCALMSVRQAIVLFVVSTLKTVDDHCGYALPFDPFQILFGNNADYHDIHHQRIGIKSNFAQPFFVHWDVLLGTRMTRQTLEERKFRSSIKEKSS